MKKLITGFAFTLLTCFALVAVAYSQTLDITQSGAYPIYPAYIDHKCGSIAVTQYSENGWRFVTVCSSGGRGTKPTVYLACWEIQFASDNYFILSRDPVLVTHQKFGTALPECPL